jgi:hypothetical protein
VISRKEAAALLVMSRSFNKRLSQSDLDRRSSRYGRTSKSSLAARFLARASNLSNNRAARSNWIQFVPMLQRSGVSLFFHSDEILFA